MVAIGIGVLVLALLGAWGLFIWNVKTVERPEYQRVEADGAIELRDYPPLIVAEVDTRGDRQQSVRRGFGPLAGYIFARSRAGERVAMTAPVTQTPREQIAMTAPVTQTAREDGRWTVRFIMPAAYTLESLPEPADGVRLERLPARRAAAIRFAGWATDARVAAQEAELRTWIERRGLRPVGPPTYAYYDDPWMPGPLRRNEVLLDVSPE
jgi:hypothetical protein